MTIASKIQALLAAQVTAGLIKEYYYDTPSKQNVRLSRAASMPAAMMTCITDRTLDITKRRAKESALVVVDYVTDMGNATTDFDGASMEAKIDAMGVAAVDFVARLREVDGIRIEDEKIPVTSLYDFMDRSTTGVRLRVNLSETIGVCIDQYTPPTE